MAMVVSDKQLIAQKEIHETLYWVNFCMTKIGLSVDQQPNSSRERMKKLVVFATSALLLLTLISVQIAYLVSLLGSSHKLADYVAKLHILGYGWISIGKMAITWFKRDSFRQLFAELSDLWPADTQDPQEAEIKQRSLSQLKKIQFWYTLINVGGVLLFNLTPPLIFLYHKARGQPADLGYIWSAAYPFDKHQPIYHELVYLFEVFSAQSSVWSMISGDLLFTTMTSHISMLLRLLQLRVRRLTMNPESSPPREEGSGRDCEEFNQEIYSTIRVHQKLIKYCDDLEEAFSLVNLINIVLSSVDICCVVFAIVFLEPLLEMSNKVFFVAAVVQMGMICWYADDIFRMSLGVSDAVYESGWYESNIKAQKNLFIMLQRSQKPIYFTAMKFSNITMNTYGSILTTAYSYFTLLYSSYEP